MDTGGVQVGLLFFQAEDGIRDLIVTGVQTCALPISVYDDLERLVTAGLADRVLLNTRPLSRIEAARIVARAIEKIRRDDAGALNERRDLEPVLDRLMEEFKIELASLGVKAPGGSAPPGFVSFLPL